MNLLKLVGDDSAGGLDVTKHDWADVLSGGEKQRIGLARVFFREPMRGARRGDERGEPRRGGAFYRKLATLGVTAFSIAHRPELLRFHHKKLTLHADGTGGWTLEDIPTNDIPRGDRDARRG